MCSQQAMVTFYRPLSTESNSIMPQLWIEMEWELNGWRNRHPRIIFQHSLKCLWFLEASRLESSWSSFFESLKKKYPGAAFIFFPFRNMIFFFSRLFSFSLSSGEVEEGIFFSAETGEEKRHFIKSCMGEMFEMAFTRAIYSHTYDSQRGKLFSPSVLIF